MTNVWVCPWTKKTFTSKLKYSRHLQRLRASRNTARLLRKHAEAVEWATKNVRNEQDFVEWFINNWAALVGGGFVYENKHWGHPRNPNKLVIPKLQDVVMTEFKAGKVWTAHSTPWDEDQYLKARAYTAYTFRLIWQFKNPKPSKQYFFYCGSRMFDHSKIHAGSGGGGGCSYQYDFTLWEKDWPAWAEQREMNHMWAILNSEVY